MIEQFSCVYCDDEKHPNRTNRAVLKSSGRVYFTCRECMDYFVRFHIYDESDYLSPKETIVYIIHQS